MRDSEIGGSAALLDENGWRHQTSLRWMADVVTELRLAHENRNARKVAYLNCLLLRITAAYQRGLEFREEDFRAFTLEKWFGEQRNSAMAPERDELEAAISEEAVAEGIAGS